MPEFDCPICLEPAATPCETNCGHAFCSGCILAFEQRCRPATLRCACCRAPVLLLAALDEDPTWVSAGAASPGLRRQLASFNLRARGGPVGWAQSARDAPMLLRRLFHQAVNRPRSLAGLLVSARVLAGLVGTCVYLVSPLDLVPFINCSLHASGSPRHSSPTP